MGKVSFLNDPTEDRESEEITKYKIVEIDLEGSVEMDAYVFYTETSFRYEVAVWDDSCAKTYPIDTSKMCQETIDEIENQIKKDIW